jgi:hypothetical protein
MQKSNDFFFSGKKGFPTLKRGKNTSSVSTLIKSQNPEVIQLGVILLDRGKSIPWHDYENKLYLATGCTAKWVLFIPYFFGPF